MDGGCGPACTHSPGPAQALGTNELSQQWTEWHCRRGKLPCRRIHMYHFKHKSDSALCGRKISRQINSPWGSLWDTPPRRALSGCAHGAPWLREPWRSTAGVVDTPCPEWTWEGAPLLAGQSVAVVTIGNCFCRPTTCVYWAEHLMITDYSKHFKYIFRS